MAYLSDDVIKEIRTSANIVDIIGEYLKVTPKGKNYVAVCPFHDDHSPSLVISPDKQIFNCFTCRTGGNVFSFVMKYENVTFPEAISIVAKKIGYDLKIDNIQITYEEKYKDEYEIMEFAKKYYLNNIFTDEGSSARKYLLDRGIDEAIIREFNIGLALKNKDTLYKLLSKKNKNIDTLENLGLINKSGIDVYDAFINRIMIPIENLKGEVVGFTGRIFNGEENTAKYMNTKETVIFKKSNILFNYHNARNYIRDAKQVIVVEGNMDAIKLFSCGIKNVVALQGVALSIDQINALKKLRVPVILMFDNDNAGLDATVKNGDLLINSGVDALIVRLSGAKDPDEYIRKIGVDALKDNIKHAKKYLDFKLEYLKSNKDLSNMEDLITYVKEVISAIKDQDDLTKELIVSKISKDYQIDAEIIKRRLEPSKKEIKKEEVPQKKKLDKYDKATSKIIYYMLNDSKYITIYQNRLGYFKNKLERVVASEIVYYNNLHGEINIADFTSYIMENNEAYEFILTVIGENNNTQMNVEDFNTYIDVILDILKKDEIKKLKMQIKEEMDVNKKLELISRLTEIKKEV